MCTRLENKNQNENLDWKKLFKITKLRARKERKVGIYIYISNTPKRISKAKRIEKHILPAVEKNPSKGKPNGNQLAA